jgi:hypothetical protein
MPLWLNITLVLFSLWIQMKAWRRLTNAFRSGETRTDEHFLHLFWPLKISGLLILSGASYYIYDCMSHPPFGFSRLTLWFSLILLGLGFFCRNWED